MAHWWCLWMSRHCSGTIVPMLYFDQNLNFLTTLWQNLYNIVTWLYQHWCPVLKSDLDTYSGNGVWTSCDEQLWNLIKTTMFRQWCCVKIGSEHWNLTKPQHSSNVVWTLWENWWPTLKFDLTMMFSQCHVNNIPTLVPNIEIQSNYSIETMLLPNVVLVHPLTRMTIS